MAYDIILNHVTQVGTGQPGVKEWQSRRVRGMGERTEEKWSLQ